MNTVPTTQVSGEYERIFLEEHMPDELGYGWTRRVQNEARERLQKVNGRPVYRGPEWEAYCALRTQEHRDEWVERWSWAVPTVAALEAIAELGPLVEIGAGTGYWTSLLRERGADVQAFEKRPVYGNGYRHRQAYAAMARGDHWRALRMYPDRIPLLCWAPYGTSMAAEVIRGTHADRLVWIGETHGCNGNEESAVLLGEGFYIDDADEPDALFEEERAIEIPTWPGMHDAVCIYRRVTT